MAREALGGETDATQISPAKLIQAVGYYLADRDMARPGWPFPPHLSADPEGVTEVDVDSALLEQLTDEASRQGVAPQRLLEHAILYFAADLDSGLVARRIAEDLEDDQG